MVSLTLSFDMVYADLHRLW